MSAHDERIHALVRTSALEHRIVTSNDGGPIRTIINGRQVKATSRYAGFKTKRGLPCEADHELGLLEISDVDAAVTEYMTQPHRLEIAVPSQSRPLIYFPDLRRELADGSIEIVETKGKKDRRLQDPDYVFKLEAAREIYESLGWTFKVLERERILNGWLYRNAHSINQWAFAAITVARQFALENAIEAAGGMLPYARAAEIVGGCPFLSPFVVRRRIRFDLTTNITDETAVSLVDHSSLNKQAIPLI
ncbi:Tn7 transposase TnsA N-terminal domain-containing protein [Rhodopseudomonas sp.]|uniref:Tn7 transposase TnsA N-terminal domain-containing protein n=1 Tax=Rhodopseudomonas sp. TaxID=1078 RepID=UPI0039E394CE